MSLIKEIRDDSQHKAFARILDAAKSGLKLEDAYEEAKRLHTSRTSRGLTGKARYSPKNLIDAAALDLSARARLVEIRVSNDRKLSHLREASEALRRYIYTEYAEDLKEFGTAEQRKAFLDRVLKKANEVLAEGDQLLSALDFLIKDLDQASHAMKHIVDCLKLLENKNGSKAI